MSARPAERTRPGTVRSAPSASGPVELATTDPVARVLVDVLPAHLDRSFDYAVPAALAEAMPGTRVRVRFAGREVGGFVVTRTSRSEHPGALTPLRRLVSPEPVLRPEIAALAETVARRYAGTRADVLRLAVPPRHARTERATPAPAAPVPGPDPAGTAAREERWAGHRAGPAFLRALARGERPRAVWTAAPATDWPALLASAAAATYSAGRGALLLTPDGRDLDRLDAALTHQLGSGHHVALRSDSGPSRRYREFLAVSRGARRIVIGTRAAAFAPVHDLGLVAVWDDGDDLYAEPRAPYPHAREVLLLRAEQQDTAVLVGGFGRSVEAHHLLRTGWAAEITPERDLVRRRLTVTVAGADRHELLRDPHARAARLPRAAHEAIRAGLELGPVLVSTPRTGYAAALACGRCRTPARCPACTGPLRLGAASSPPDCGWCGREAPGWRCPACGDRRLRAPVLGDVRTAEELGRAFPGARVLTSTGTGPRATVPAAPALVVATPAAEPVAEEGYAAVVLLDTWLALARPDLRVAEESLRRWLNAAALARSGGRVVAVGDPALAGLQALVRWDPAGFAERETAERRSARLPPASRLAILSGDADAVQEALDRLRTVLDVDVLGPVPLSASSGAAAGPALGPPPAPAAAGDPPERLRAVVRVPRRHGEALSAALADGQRFRSARKLASVRVQVDPVELG